MKPYRRVLARLGLVVVAISATLSAFEIGLRIKGYQAIQWSDRVNPQLLTATDNAELPYVLTPNASGRGWDTDIAVNSQGFRDREFSVAKGDRFRIAAIGDSITFGSRLAPPSALYPKQLERLLQLHHPASNIEVLNFGVTGYDVANDVEHLRVRALKFQPDIVILGFCVNDIGTSSTAIGYVRASKYLAHPLFRFRVPQFILSTSLKVVAERQAQDDQDINVFKRVNGSRILPIDEDAELDEQIDRIAEMIRGESAPGLIQWWTERPRIGFLEYGFSKLRALKLRYGFEVVVVAVPFLDQREKAQWRTVHEIVRHETLKYGFHFADVFEPFELAGLWRLRNDPADKIHPGVEGHAILAAALERYLTNSGLLSRTRH